MDRTPLAGPSTAAHGAARARAARPRDAAFPGRSPLLYPWRRTVAPDGAGSCMPSVTSFYSEDERSLGRDFLERGYVVREVCDRAALEAIREEVVRLACRHLKCPRPNDPDDFLNNIHKLVAPVDLNALRLAIYHGVNDATWLRPSYFAVARRYLEQLVGNELAMQNRINLSIQMANDDSSILPIHADAFGGETPFQVVAWLPLVDCYRTKSMFILPYAENRALLPRMKEFRAGGMAEAYDAIKDRLVWLDVPFGSVLVFSTNQLHGNIVNTEATTRWSMNCRFTGLFTPYTSQEKKLGSFYLPITTRPVTQVGLDYEPPGGFEE
jgi:sporadic carbohydrate cluster 2OG-Fe(II) oxygenase